MICNVCKKEWVSSPDDTRCPHCGADLVKGTDQHTIPGVISFLIKKEGTDILLKPDTVMSYISDLVQGHDREKKLIRVGSTNGIFQKAHAILVEPKQSRREVMVLDAKRHLMDNAFLSEANAVALVNMALEGIGLPSLRLKAEPEQVSKPQSKKPAVQQPKTERTHQEKPKPTRQTSSPPTQPVPKKPVRQSNTSNKPFRLNTISTFEYDGSSFASRKVQGPLFLRGEARMIGILVTYDAVIRDMNVSLDWQIFRQDGSPVTGLIHGGGTVKQGDTDYYQGWGWQTPGNWAAGRYTIKASMNGSNQLTTYFDIVEGRYDNPLLSMNEVKLFSAGAVPPAVADRKYSAMFYSQQARRIYFEISLQKMTTPV
ncbi:MAG: hypothetical protein IJK38_05425, partial [Oscillospiraceae bacterium]|nr:hypothetical protein [Oscillospiraceae bacterium]